MIALREYLAVLKNKNFAKLWVSQVCSQLTNFLLSYAILIKAFRLTESSLSVAVMLLSFGLATVVFGAFAGVYADRFDRKWIMTIINFAQAATLGLFLIFENDFWALAGITFLYSALNQFYLPAEAPSIPNVVPRNQLLAANSYFSFTVHSSMILGFAMSGLLVSYFGFPIIFISGMVLLTAAGCATLSLPNLKPNLPRFEFFKNVWHEFRGGVRYFWRDKMLHFPLATLVLGQLINGALITLAPLFVSSSLGLDLERGSFFAILPLGLGVLVGVLALAVEARVMGKRQLIVLGFAGKGIMLVLLGIFPQLNHQFGYYALIGFLIGYFNAHVFAPAHTLLQTYADETARGRIYGALYVLLQAAATLPAIVFGFLADRFALNIIFLGLGLVLGLFSVGFYLRRNPTITGLDKNYPTGKIRV